MIITKVMDPAHLIGYQLVLTRVAEECGGARTAYYYDLLLRQKLAKELEKELRLYMVFCYIWIGIFSATPRKKSKVVPK